MKRYNYRAKDRATGRTVSGTIQADSEQSAGRILLDQGYIPQRVVVEDEGVLSKLQSKVSAKDRIAFTRQFATLISAGLPLSASLQMIAEQGESKAVRTLVEELLAQVESGKSLHEAFAKHPDVFNKVYLSIIEAGEASGTLDVSLKRLADQQEKDESMISKIRSALTYPAIVLVVIVAVVAFLMVMVVPQVENLYNDLGEPLPELTKFMVGISNFTVNYWWTVLIALAVLTVFFVQFKKTKLGSQWWAKFKLNVPIFKQLLQRLYNARFARTMEMLLAAGVPMLEALQISAEAVNNVIFEEQIKDASTMVRGGKPLSVAIKGRDYILPLLPQMAATGEQSGKIDEMLGRAAQVYEDELDARIEAISTLIQPVLMVVLAVVAGGIVAAILFPIYTLVSKISTGGM